jgi:hypothetical protein
LSTKRVRRSQFAIAYAAAFRRREAIAERRELIPERLRRDLDVPLGAKSSVVTDDSTEAVDVFASE